MHLANKSDEGNDLVVSVIKDVGAPKSNVGYYGGLQESFDLDQEGHSIINQFGDLSIKRNRIALVKVMIMSKALPGLDLDNHRLERAVAKLSRRAMNEVVATFAEVFKADREAASIVLERFQAWYGCE